MPRISWVLLVAILLFLQITSIATASMQTDRQMNVGTQKSAPGNGLNLQDVLVMARENNPDLLMASARIENAEAMLKKSAAPFYPQVNLYTEYLQGDAPSSYLFKTIDQRKLPPDTDFNDPGWFENFESGVNAGINLYSGGRDRLNRKIAQTGLTLSQLDRDSVENRIVAAAIGAYYDVIAATHYIEVAEESVDTTASQLRIMDVRYQSGGALRTDLLSLEVRMAETREILVQSNSRRELAEAALAELLGLDPTESIRVIESEPHAIKIPDDPVSAMDHAVRHRPELAGSGERLRQSELAFDSARAGYLPQVDFLARYYANDPQMKYSSERANWTAGLFLNWKIFDGFTTKHERAEARSQVKETKAADRKTLLAVKFDVKKAYLNLYEAQERLKVASATVTTAKETYELVTRQYEGGSAGITRYLESELAYNRARMRETTAIFDEEKARAQIGRAIGFFTGMN